MLLEQFVLEWIDVAAFQIQLQRFTEVSKGLA
jgi:hypothetical protein